MALKGRYKEAIESIRLNRDGRLMHFHLTIDGRKRLMFFRWMDEKRVKAEIWKQFKTTEFIIDFIEYAEEVDEKAFALHVKTTP